MRAGARRAQLSSLCLGPVGYRVGPRCRGGGAQVPGGAQRGGLGGALLGLAQLGDGFGESGEADEKHDGVRVRSSVR